MTSFPERKSWLLCQIDGIPRLNQIQRNDALMLVPSDAAAVRRARCEARRGIAVALPAVALHQRGKRAIDAYRFSSSVKGGAL